MPQHPLGEEALQFKMKHKIDYHHPDKVAMRNDYPPPGTYEDQTALNAEGKYSSTFFNNSKAARWGKDEKLKFPKEIYRLPGPGYHESLGNTSDNLGV